MALTAVRCGAQNSVVIGATADITGLEAAGGSIENDPKQAFGSIRWAYELTFTFQKIGAPNLRMSRTFLRKAVGWTHSPHGTYVTSLRATFWTSPASCFRFVSSAARTQSIMSFRRM